MESQPALTDLGIAPTHRSFAGHVLSLGIHVFIFGGLAYLTFLNQGGLPGTLLLIYLSALPLAFAVELLRAARAEQRIAAHHVLKGCMTAVVACGLGGVWVLFREQIAWGLVGSAAVVWITRYSPAATLLKPPSLQDLTGSAASRESQTTRTLVTIAGAVALLAGGIALTALAVIGELHHPGGFTFSYTTGG